MTRLCFLTDYALTMGGKERQLLELCTALSELGLWVMVLSISAKGILPEQLKKRSIRCVVVKREDTCLWSMLSQINSLISQHEISHCYSFDTLSHFLVVIPSLLYKVKLINGSIRDAGTEKNLNYIIVLLSLMMSKYVIANSKAGLAYYRIRRNCAVLYNALDMKRFTKSNIDCTRIVMVANFTAYKDQKCLIRAVTRLVSQGYTINCTFIGDGTTLSDCKSYARDLCDMNVFDFLGYTADVESVLADHGIGVLCSTKKYKEGVSNSILEYMGSDLIAVASDVGATKEIIADKTNGFLFQAEDSISLTNTLRYVIDNWDVMHVIRNHAHETLIEKFDAIANGNRMIEILNEI